MTVTNHMLRKKIAQVNRESLALRGANTRPVSALEEEGTVMVYTESIVKIKNDVMITETGKQAKLFMPMPCLHWKCLTAPDSSGVITLAKKLEGLFLDDGDTVYCLGVNTASDEFEVRLQVGTAEVRLNSSVLNLNAKHIVKNGVEMK